MLTNVPALQTCKTFEIPWKKKIKNPLLPLFIQLAKQFTCNLKLEGWKYCLSNKARLDLAAAEPPTHRSQERAHPCEHSAHTNTTLKCGTQHKCAWQGPNLHLLQQFGAGTSRWVCWLQALSGDQQRAPEGRPGHIPAERPPLGKAPCGWGSCTGIGHCNIWGGVVCFTPYTFSPQVSQEVAEPSSHD